MMADRPVSFLTLAHCRERVTQQYRQDTPCKPLPPLSLWAKSFQPGSPILPGGLKSAHRSPSGSPQMITDLLSKQIGAVIDLSGGYLPQLQSDNLRALAIIGGKPCDRLPGIEPMKDQGLNLSVEASYAMEGPKGVSREIVNQPNAAVTGIRLHEDNTRANIFMRRSHPHVVAKMCHPPATDDTAVGECRAAK